VTESARATDAPHRGYAGGDERETLIETLVAQALDDLDDSRLDTPALLRMLATFAWDAGYREGRQRHTH
jgi:hypothetical protein